MKTSTEKLTRSIWVRAIVIGLAALLLLGPAYSQAKPRAGGMLVTPVYPTAGLEVTVANHPPQAIPYFQWAQVPGATSYHLQVCTQIGCNDGTRLIDLMVPNERYLPIGLPLADGSYYWRVRAFVNNSWGDWPLTPWQFSRNWAKNNAPALLQPAAGQSIEFFEDPIFSWTAVIGAARYMLRLDNDADCLSPFWTTTTIQTHFTPATRFANGNYYWCVMPLDPANRFGQLSVLRMLVVNYQRTTQLLEPADGSTPVYTPQFRWTAVKGAIGYRLRYTTDSTFQQDVNVVDVNQTTFTLASSLPNDRNYYWRVHVLYGGGIEGPASETWTFQKRWYHKPIVVTPNNNEVLNVQYFAWTPVREAAYYVIEGSLDSNFTNLKWSGTTRQTSYFRNEFPVDEWGATIYLRVRPVDNGGNPGKESDVISYRPRFDLAYTEPLYPYYYYVPPSVVTGNYTTPHDIPVSVDYTVDVPTFYWMRTFVPGLPTRTEADQYRLEVASDINFDNIVWTYYTQNLSATPDDTTPWLPSATVYYWRVVPLAAGGTPLPNSAVAKARAVRIDTARLVTPTVSAAPQLQRPTDNEKAMDTLPSFEWLPQQNAVRYEFELASDVNFSSPVYVTRTVYTHHTPNVRLAKGTYFWRVRGLDSNGQPVGTGWSESRRLILAYITRWEQTWGYPNNPLFATSGTLLATTPGSAGPGALSTLYAAQDAGYWYVGFNISPVAAGNVVYGLYLDRTQITTTGATFAPVGRPAVTTVSYYRPEYALYMVFSNTTMITTQVDLYEWDGAANWKSLRRNLVDPLDVGGSFTYSPTTRYAELKIPKSAIGDGGTEPYMLSLALFSAASYNSTVTSDTVPFNGANTAVLTEFKSISDRFTLSLPPTDPSLTIPMAGAPFMYAETGNVDHLRGFKVEVARDSLFTNIIDRLVSACVGCWDFVDIFPNIYLPTQMYEDNTLYWRYFVRHFNPASGLDVFTAPSEPHVFSKVGPTPANLRTEGNFSTPTFRWDDVEGGAYYQLQWSTNPDFAANVAGIDTNHNNYTLAGSMVPSTYYARVRQGNGNYVSPWSPISTAVITLPTASISQPGPGSIVSAMPTFRWESVLTPTVKPAWGAPYYHLQVAYNPRFDQLTQDVVLDTINWTPASGFPDGTYYWRVAVRDASNNDSPFSAIYTFTKQYPAVTLLSPASGGTVGDYQEFSWTPIASAALYRLQIARDPQFTVNLRTVDTYQSAVIFNDAWSPGRYYWRVAMIDSDNNVGPYTDATLIVDPRPYRVYAPLMQK